jgi:hypothetical protein
VVIVWMREFSLICSFICNQLFPLYITLIDTQALQLSLFFCWLVLGPCVRIISFSFIVIGRSTPYKMNTFFLQNLKYWWLFSSFCTKVLLNLTDIMWPIAYFIMMDLFGCTEGVCYSFVQKDPEMKGLLHMFYSK